MSGWVIVAWLPDVKHDDRMDIYILYMMLVVRFIMIQRNNLIDDDHVRIIIKLVLSFKSLTPYVAASIGHGPRPSSGHPPSSSISRYTTHLTPTPLDPMANDSRTPVPSEFGPSWHSLIDTPFEEGHRSSFPIRVQSTRSSGLDVSFLLSFPMRYTYRPHISLHLISHPSTHPPIYTFTHQTSCHHFPQWHPLSRDGPRDPVLIPQPQLLPSNVRRSLPIRWR